MNDIINGAFEVVGAYFVWRNVLQLYRDRSIKGVYWPTFGFFASWGLWNMWYYSALDQWASFVAGAFLCAGNVAWVLLALRIKGRQ